MTDNEIIKALECCGKGFGNCEGCPYDDDDNDCVTNDGKTLVIQDALDLINRQKAEIEKLEEMLDCSVSNERNAIDSISYEKSEAIKEFAERLKAGSIWVDLVSFTRIDNILKEMVGKNEN